MVVLRILSFKLDDVLLERLVNYAREKNKPVSEVIRMAIRYYLDDHQGNGRPYITKRIRVY